MKKLKIGFVYILPDKATGIFLKINSQAKIVYQHNKSVRFIIFLQNFEIFNIDLPPNLIIEKIPKFPPKTGFYFTPKYIVNYCNHEGYNVIITRLYGFSPFFFISFRRRNFKLIIEYHTIISNEYLRLKRYDLHILYLIFKKLSDKVIDGKMCVTNEIKKFESFKNPMITISNGYDNKIFDYPNYQPFDGKNLKILSVCSVLQPWHGLERLFQSVKIWQINNPGLKIELDIVGDFNFSRFDARILPNLVKFHGVKNKDEIIEIAKNSNIAVSSLALYLNNMTEACPLKSREYISIGIPFFYGYDDIDIPSDNIFGLKIPNENNLIEISTILVWLNNIKSNSIKLELDWHFLRKNISWEAKLKKYLDFVMEVQGFK